MPLLPPVTQEFTVNATEFLAGLDEMLAGLDRVAQSINAVAASADRLSGTSDAAAGSTDAFAASIGRADAAMRTEVEAISALNASVDETVAAVDEATAAIDRETIALTEAAGAATKTDEETVAAGSHMKMAFLAVAAGVAYAVVKGAEFQTQVTRLYSAAGLTGNQYEWLSHKILEIGDATGQTGTAIAEALYHPVSAGLSLKTALAAVTYGAQLAAIHGANLDDTMYALSSVMKSYNQNASDAGKTSALLNSIVGEGDMRFQDFVQSVANWAPTGASMGISIRSMGAALAYLTDRGNSAESAATRLTMGLSMVTSPSKEASTYLNALGLEAGSVALKNKSLADVMNSYGVTTSKVAADLKKPDGIYVALSQIQGAFRHAGLSASQADAVMAKIFGGGRSDKAIVALMQNLDGLRTKYEDIGRGVSHYGSSWAKTQQTVSFEFHKTVASVQNLAISFGAVLLPAVDKVLTGISKFLGFLQKTPEVAAFAGGILAIVGAMKLMEGAEAVMGLVSGAIGTIGAAASAATPEVGALDAALDANVIGVVLAAVLALGLGLYELYKHCAVVREIVADVARFFEAAWKMAMEAAGAVVHWFVTGPLAFIKGELKVFEEFWRQNGQEIDKIVKAGWTVISAVFKVGLDYIKGYLSIGLDVIETVWKVAWAVVYNVVKTVWDVIAIVIRDTIREVLDIISIVLDLITGKWGQAWDHMKDLVGTALHEVGDVIKTVVSGFVNMLYDAGKAIIQGFVNGIKSMFGAVGSVMSDIGHGAISAFKSVLGIFSPSKVMEELALDVGAGIIKGLEGSVSSVKSSADKLASAVKTAFEHGIIGSREATSLTDFINRDNNRLQDLANKREKILKEIATAKKYATSTQQSVESWAGLSNVVGAMPSGSVITSAGLEAGLSTDLATIKKFNDAIRKLSRLGLNHNLLNQIIQAGPTDGLAMAEALLNGPVSEIKALNKTESQITSQSKTLGRSAADAMYDSGKDAGKGFLSGLEHQQKSIEQMMKRLARVMVDTIRKELGIHSPSTVAQQHAELFGDGLVVGLDNSREKVGAASKRLAGAMSLSAGGLAAGAGGGQVHVDNSITVHVTVPAGFVGSNAQLAGEIGKAVQTAVLQVERRNPTAQYAYPGGR